MARAVSALLGLAALAGACTPRPAPVASAKSVGEVTPLVRLLVDEACRARRCAWIEERVPAHVRDFAAPLHYGTAPDILQFIEEARATDGTGKRLEVQRQENLLQVQGAPEGSITLRYRYRIPQATPGEVHHELPTMSPDHARFDANLTFLVPRGLEERPARLEVQVPAGWTVATSWGAGTRFAVRRLADLTAGLVVAGKIRPLRRAAGRTEITLVALGQLSVAPDRFFAALAAILQAQQELVGPLPAERLLVVLQAGARRPSGTSLTNGLYVAVPEAADLTAYPILGTIAHELFHQWNARLVRPRRDDGALLVTEGFTNYFTVVSMVRARVIAEAEMAAFLAAYRRKLEENPRYPGPDFAAIQAGHTVDDALRELAYVKGPFVALALDLALRRDTAGRANLGTWFRELRHKHGGQMGYELDDLAALTRKVSGKTDGEATRVFREALLGGGALDLDALFTALGLQCPAAGPCTLAQEPERVRALRRAVFGGREIEEEG